jgi:hypothetical protein
MGSLWSFVERGLNIAAHGWSEDQQAWWAEMEDRGLDPDMLIQFRDIGPERREYTCPLKGIPAMGNRSAADEPIGIDETHWLVNEA